MSTHLFAQSPPRRAATLWLMVILTCLWAVLPTQAQPQTLQFGVGSIGQIDSVTPVSLFVFSGTEGDLINVRVVGLTGGFIPTLSLLSPSQLPVGTAQSNNATLSISAVLPATGAYSILVGSLNAQPGEFAIRLDSNTTAQAVELLPDDPIRAEFSGNGEVQVLTFPVTETTVLQFGDPSASIPPSGSLKFSAQVVTAMGGQVASYSGLYAAQTVIPSDAGRTYVIVTGASSEDIGGLDIVLRAPGGSTSAGETTTQPAATSQPIDPSGVCTVVAGPNGVNVRSGDGTGFGVVGQLPPGESRPVTGRNASSTWYTIDVNGSTGWVAAQVVTVGGSCANLSVVSAGSPPAVQPTATTGQQVGPTATTTGPTEPPPPTVEGATQAPPPTLAPTMTPTTESPAAPPDADPHRWDVDRNNGGTFSEFVSYPSGDTSDRVELRINLGQVGGEATRDVTVTLNCNGNGTQNIRFTRTSPNAQRFGCGQSITFRYSAPFSTGMYYVFLEDGGPSYVNYTLVATTAP